MARTVRDSNLETRTARGRLKSRKKPYWRSIDRGLHLGYFKGARGPAFAPMVSNGHHYGGAEAYANACLRRLALAPEGHRHNTCVAVSCRLLALSKAGLLDPVRVAGQIKGVMAGKGVELPEVDAILEWAWQQVGPEGLSHGR